jgi:hypothetical protein
LSSQCMHGLRVSCKRHESAPTTSASAEKELEKAGRISKMDWGILLLPHAPARHQSCRDDPGLRTSHHTCRRYVRYACELPAARHSLRHGAWLVVARLLIGGAQRQHRVLQATAPSNHSMSIHHCHTPCHGSSPCSSVLSTVYAMLKG